MDDFAGRTAVVTGASRGIGEACARALDRRGARIALVARDGRAMEVVASELANDPIVVEADFASVTGASDAARQISDALGPVDVLVNNAGILTMEPASGITQEALDDQLTVNLRNAIVLTSALTAGLVQRGGSIVNVSSVSAYGGGPAQAVYAATKGALNSFSANLARELGPHGVRVNSVVPGLIDTDMWAPVFQQFGEELRSHFIQNVPLGRWGTAADVASLVCFLCSDAASYITGQSIRVDGGMIV